MHQKTKITVKLYEPLFRKFDKQLDELHLKRDSFLDHMIRAETPRLVSELEGRRQSDLAKRYVARSLKRMGTVRVNLEISKSTAHALREIVREANIVRDAFINRLILLLRGSDFLVHYLNLPKAIPGSGVTRGVEPMPTSPMKAIEAVQTDPLYYFRSVLEDRGESGLYLAPFPTKLIGFSCYLEEAAVPGTEAHEEEEARLAELLKQLDSFERTAFSKNGERQ